MATLKPTISLSSTDALSDATSFSVTDSLSVLGDVKRISYVVAHPPGVTDILTASAYNKSYVFLQNKSATASEIITIGKKSTDATVDTTGSDATITMDSTANISVGMSITGTNIQSATTINSITNGTTAEMSKTATGTASNITATFGTEDFITLGAGEFAFFPWSGTENLEASSADGTPTLEVMIFEATA